MGLSAIATICIRPGRVSLPLSRRLRGSQPCGCTSPETGNDLLSLSISPAEAGHMVGVAQRKSNGLQSRMPRVRIPPRPPGRIRVRCQKWESPNLSSADSRQRPPAGIEPCPAVIWDSGVWAPIRIAMKEIAGSNPACPTKGYPHPAMGIGSGKAVLALVCRSIQSGYFRLLRQAAVWFRISIGKRARLITADIWVRLPAEPPTPKPCVVHGSGLMPCPDGSIRLT